MEATGQGDPMAIRGDGFIAHHVRVEVEAARSKALGEQIRALEGPFRRQGVDTPFPRAFEQRLRSLPGVRQVITEGAYSSIIIPLRLIRSWTERPVIILSGCVGTGPVAQYVSGQLKAAGLTLELKQWEGDTPLEISLWEDAGLRQVVRLYMPRQFRHTLRLAEPEVRATGAFLVSRYNAGRIALAARLHAAGRYTALRIGAMNRYVAPAHYLEALRYFHHVVLSTAEGSMKQITRALGIPFPASPWEPPARTLAEALGHHQGGRRLVVLIFHESGSALFYVPGQEPVVLRAPAHLGLTAPVARPHGACAALALHRDPPVPLRNFLPDSPETLAAFAGWAMQAAYYGTDCRPTIYPDPSFRPEGSWQASGTHASGGKGDRWPGR